jgi:predicted O-methyltransferase YrrM
MGRSLLPDDIAKYVTQTMVRESEVAHRLREETAKHPFAQMQISADQGALLSLFVHLIGARRCLEIGTFTGYSALAVASALPPDGKIICCDVSEEWTSIGRRYWAEAGVADRVDLRLAPALDTLKTLAPPFDMAFIDADKANYGAYYDECLRLVRKNGLILVDNTLWSGKVCAPPPHDDDTAAIVALNARAMKDERVEPVLVSIGDGMLVLRVR